MTFNSSPSLFDLPISFDYSEDPYPGIECELVEDEDCWRIHFADLNISFLYDDEPFTKQCYFLKIQTIERLNPDFKAHGRFGYSIGSFHEFFLSIYTESTEYIDFYIGDTEISLGDATPLGQLIFNSEHESKYHGDWECIPTIKLLNVDQDNVEIYLLNALNRIQVSNGFKANPQSISYKDYNSWLEESVMLEEREEELEEDAVINNRFNLYKDCEAVSLYRCALTQVDDISACIYYYRIVEFYAFSRKHREIEKIRQDTNIDSQEFSKKIHNLVKANERDNVCGLVEEVLTSSILDFAFHNNLIGPIGLKSKRNFSDALYNFRNSIVHAKYEHTSSLVVHSILNPSSKSNIWREIMSRLIPEVLNKFGV
jgi:hypothetical protein